MENSQSANEGMQQPMMPAEELNQLEIFVGKWKIEGKNLMGAPASADQAVTGEETYEWLPGSFFLMGHWNHQASGSDHVGTGIFKYDSVSRSILTSNYDNLGYNRDYSLRLERQAWTFMGEKERATRKFTDDGNSFTENWEILSEDSIWQPLCVLRGEKIS